MLARIEPANIVLKNLNELPPHITYQQFNQLLEAVEAKYRKRKYGKTQYWIQRDKLFLRLLWETGGRVSDVCQLTTGDIDIHAKAINLHVQKTRKTLVLPMTADTMLEIAAYIREYNIQDRLFPFSRVQGWYRIRDYGRMIGIDGLHPHMFRHGLAIHLLQNGVPIPVIAARLGHASIKTTMETYLVITPELQRKFVENVLR